MTTRHVPSTTPGGLPLVHQSLSRLTTRAPAARGRAWLASHLAALWRQLNNPDIWADERLLRNHREQLEAESWLFRTPR